MRGRREDLHRINQKIVDTPTVRVVGEGVEAGGIFPISKAMEMAFEEGLDLVEISPNAEPPVCRIVDYKKYLFEQKKKQKELKANAVNNEVKEIRFGPNTDEHDVDFKLNHARKFLNEGSKVRAYVFFKGRTIVYKERGEVLLLKFAEKLQEEGVAKLELMPKTEGKKMFMLLAPAKKK
ncbi:MAG: translation initiation factor IF-3 [Bacteroidia bacterium]|nr:translation initiation factor IF-3 [Bacteroidia bacterium]